MFFMKNSLEIEFFTCVNSCSEKKAASFIDWVNNIVDGVHRFGQEKALDYEILEALLLKWTLSD